MHCNIYIQHFEQNNYSTMEHGTFSDWLQDCLEYALSI